MTAARKKRKKTKSPIGHSKKVPAPKAGTFPSLILNLSIGIAAGFAVWTTLVPLSGESYHMGALAERAKMAAAAGAAGILWIKCSAIGAAAGLILVPFVAPVILRFRSLPERLAIAAIGVYALAFRGAWSSPEGELPVVSWFLPTIIAILMGLLLVYLDAKLKREPERNNSSPFSGLLPLHLCLSFAAAHFTVKLPYYTNLAGAFIGGLRDIIFLLTGF